MNDFLMFFFALMVIVAILDGVSEGLHLSMFDFSHGGSQKDHFRKFTDALEFGIPVAGMLGVVWIYVPSLGLDSFDVILLVIHALGVRWTLRDGFQNVITGQEFFYVGTVAAIDKLTRPLGITIIAALKIGSAVLPMLLILMLK